MKHTKRLLTWILAVVLIIGALCLVACVEKPTPQQLTDLTAPNLKGGQVAVIIKNDDDTYTQYVVNLTEQMTKVEHVLQYLKDNDMPLDWTDSNYGKMINGIGTLALDATKNEFVAFFTSVQADKGNWAGVPTYTLAGNTQLQIVSAQVGVSDASVESGAVFYFEISTY